MKEKQLPQPLTNWQWWLFENPKQGDSLPFNVYIRVIAYAVEEQCFFRGEVTPQDKPYTALYEPTGQDKRRVRPEAAIFAIMTYQCGIRIDPAYTALRLAELPKEDWEAIRTDVENVRARNERYDNKQTTE